MSPKNPIEKIVRFEEDKPFEVLGPRLLPGKKGVAIQAFLPLAREAWVEPGGKGRRKKPMRRVAPEGFFEALFDAEQALFPYRIGFQDDSGYIHESEDPYAFSTQISDYDLYLIGEGTHYKTYEKFGARLVSFADVPGVHFAVWAPNARAVSVIGNFNHWREGAHPMTRIDHSGVWGLFVPRLKEGELYKYAIKSAVDSAVRIKADPYAFAVELRPRTASVVTALGGYRWGDADWMARRRQQNPLDKPISVYEVHLGSWKKDPACEGGFLNYKELAEQLVAYAKQMGYTHLELLPVMEHPLDASWGYQVVNYYAPTSRFGKPEDFMYFVDHCHQNGIGVLLDWVPAHFPKDGHGLADFDGRQIYAYESWKKGEQKDWGTLVFDFGKNEVRNFLISNALFWLEKYHVDGLRVDAVASMIYLDYSRKPGEWEPNPFGGRENLEAIRFLTLFNEIVHKEHPGILTIAEESTAWPAVSRPTYLGGLGFSLKWNMGWMHDSLDYFSHDPVFRKYHQDMLTFSLLYAFSENFVLPISHDEVVHGKKSLLEKMPGDEWQKFANLRLFLGYLFAHPGKKLLFMGADLAQRREWNDQESVDWPLLEQEAHQKIHLLVGDLNRIYREHPALYELDFDPAGFEWLDFSDAESSVISFSRWSRDKKELILVTANWTPVPRTHYRIGVPRDGFYEELLNTDAREYGGSGMGNLGGLAAEKISCHGRPYSLELCLPPLAVNFFRHNGSIAALK